MGSLSTPSSFSPFVPFVTLLAAAPPGRDGSTAGSFPFNDNRHKKQKEGILKIIKISYVVSEKAAQHDEFTRAPGGSSAAVYHTRDGKGLRIAGAGCFSPIDADAIPFFLPVISCGSPGPQKLDVQLERVIAAFDNRKYIKEDLAIKGNLAAAFTKERVEICRTRFTIPKVHLVDGLKKNLISVSQLHKDDGLCCCFHSKICEVILADGTVVGGAILLDDGTKYVSSRCHLNQKSEADKASHVNIYTYIWTMVHTYRNDGMYELRFLEVPAEPEEYKLKKNLISVSQLDKKGRSEHNHLDIILDSGASMHATGNLRLLSEFTRAPGGSSAAIYHTRDGRDLRIAGVGMIACDKFHLPHVHYVPELGSRFTLASVQLLAGCDYLVMFCGGWCYVKNRNNGSHVGRGRMHDEDGLYHLEYLRIPHFVVGGAN